MERFEERFEGAIRKIMGLGIFWVITAIVATSILPDSWKGLAGLFVLAFVLAAFGSIALSLVFGGDGFDYLGHGFLLALFGYLLVKFGFGWDFENPSDALRDLLSPTGPIGLHPDAQPRELSAGALIGAVFLPMAMDFGKMAVGMGIVAIPTLPVIFLLKSKRRTRRRCSVAGLTTHEKTIRAASPGPRDSRWHRYHEL